MDYAKKCILLNELCMRLTSGVKVRYKDKVMTVSHCPSTIYDKVTLICLDKDTCEINQVQAELDEIKIYLRPMSSMTEFEEHQFYDICTDIAKDKEHFIMEGSIDSQFMVKKLTFLLSHHIDFTYMIRQNLAIEATEDIYK